MLWLYRLLFLPLTLLAAPYYGWRMRRRGGYGAHFGQRFGTTPELPPRRPGVRRIWLQAVSVGELLAVAPLLEAWRRDPGVEVYLSTTTSTGYALAEERYRKSGAVIGLGYFPLDFWPCSARAWRSVRADIAILTEGERWPEHMRQAAGHGAKVVAINARLSDRSFRRMSGLGVAARLLVRGLDCVLAASAGDAERFQKLGVPAARVVVTGNLKLDVSLPAVSPDEAKCFRRELGLGEAPLLLGASTWPGEEAALLEAWRGVAAKGWKLLIVPRHSERRGEIAALLDEDAVRRGTRWHLRSRGDAPAEVDVAVADTTGELARLLTLGEIVFVGKTLPPHTEGQTPVESAARGKALILGPGTANFRAIAAELDASGAAVRASDAAALREVVAALADDAAQRLRVGEAGLRWHGISRGAAERTLSALAEISRAQK